MPHDTFEATLFDAHYPSRLRLVEPIPERVEAEGPLARDLPTLTRAVAIVGTRAPCDRAVEFTRWLAGSLAACGIVIVSGGARGIDVAAHEAAIDAGGRTIAVLPGGIDVYTPHEHASLFDEVRARGALVAIRPRGVTPQRFHFLQRNGVIAALADHVVLISAPLQSGARSTAAHARRLQTPLWVVPGAPWDESMAGCAEELVRGGRALTSATPLFDALDVPRPSPCPGIVATYPTGRASSAMSRATRTTTRPTRGLRAGRAAVTRTAPLFVTSAERAVHSALLAGAKSLDDLVVETGLAVGALRALLLTWTVEGVVRETPAGHFALAAH